MTEEELTIQVDISKVVVSILKHYKTISVPTDIFMEETDTDKQLEIKYDEETKSFIFTLGEENEAQSNSN
jgi:hypothetical protein